MTSYFVSSPLATIHVRLVLGAAILALVLELEFFNRIDPLLPFGLERRPFADFAARPTPGHSAPVCFADLDPLLGYESISPRT